MSPMTVFDPRPAALRLAGVWKGGGARLKGLPPGERPADAAQGYAIQDKLRALIGEPLAGYKLGLSSPAAMKVSGLGRPARGFVTKPRLYPSNATAPAAPAGRILFELEICFVVGRAVAAGASEAEKLAAMSAAHLGIELVNSRLADRLADGVPSFLADDIGFHGYVLGPEIDRAEWTDAFLAEARIEQDGQVVAGNLIDDARTRPVEALSMFIDDAAEAGWPVEPGMLITTGTLVAAYETADIGQFAGYLGRYAVNCTVA